MKNLLLSLLLIASTIPILRAQKLDEITTNAEKKAASIPMNKGSRFLGLNGSGGFGGGPYGKHNTWTATGQGGYFVADRLLMGAQLSYGESNYNLGESPGSAVGGNVLSHRFVYINPELFARYYFTSGKVRPFVQASTGWNFTSGNQTYLSSPTATINENNFTAKASLGVSFKLGKRVGLDLMYSRSLLGNPKLGDFNGLRLGLTFLIGK